MVDRINIKDANDNTIKIHTIEDSTSTHFNQSIPTDSAGNIATVVSSGQAVDSTHGALAVGLSPNSPLPAGTNHLGKVSIAGQFDVSVGPVTANIADNAPVSIRAGRVSVLDTFFSVGVNSFTASQNIGVSVNTLPDNAPVSVRGGVLGAVSLGGGSAIIGKVSTVGEVSVHLLPNADKVVIGAVSLADSALTVNTHAVTQSGTWTVQPGNTANTTPWLVSVGGNVSLTDNAPVSVRGGILGAVSLGGGTATIGKLGTNTDKVVIGAVSVADSALPRLSNNVDKIVIGAVSIADAAITVNTHAVTQSGKWLVSVTDPLPAGTNAIGKLAQQSADNVLIGAVSLAGTITASGITQVVSVGGAVSVQAVQIAGTDGTNARTPKTDTGGKFLLGATGDKVVIGAVSIADDSLPVVVSIPPITLADNAPVSVHGGILGAVSLGGGSAIIGKVSIADGTLAVTQSGTWTVQPGNTANTTPWLVSVGGNVSLTDNAPVSIRGGVLGAVSLGGGSAIIGRVSTAGEVSVHLLGNADKVVIGAVSIADSTVVLGAGTALIGAVSVRGNILGAVSIQNIADVSVQDNAPVSVRGGLINAAQNGTWTVQPGNTANTTPWLVSVGGNVSLTDNAPVSIRGGVLGAVSLGGGTAAIGTVQPGNTKNTTPWRVEDVPTSNGGLQGYTAIVSAITTGSLIKGAAGQVYSITAGNNGTAPLFLKLYNIATAPAASTSVNYRFIVPTSGGFVLNIDKGLEFSLGIGWNITAGLVPGDTTAPADNQGFINIFYK